MVLHEIDSSGDTILTLHNPNAPLGVWDSSNRPANALARAPPIYPITSKKGRKMPRDIAKYPSELSGDNTASDPSDEEQVKGQGSPLVQFRLSSKHLILSSGYFRRMMTGPWKEAARDPESNFAVDASDWNENAFLALMNIVHGRTRDVPPKIDLKFATQLAVMTDYYQCHQLTEIWFEHIWKGQISDWASTAFWATSIRTMFISWVFPDPHAFSILTLDASKNSRGPIQTLGLAFPADIIDAIEEQRQRTVVKIVAHLHQVYATLCSQKPTCSVECSSMLIGALARQVNIGLLHPWPEAPYLGYSVSGLLTATSKLKEPKWINQNYRCLSPKPLHLRSKHSLSKIMEEDDEENPVDRCKCSLASLVTQPIRRLAEGMKGLELSKFSKSERGKI